MWLSSEGSLHECHEFDTTGSTFGLFERCTGHRSGLPLVTRMSSWPP